MPIGVGCDTSSTLRVDNSMKDNPTNRTRPLRVQTSTVKKSAATISSQCPGRLLFPSRGSLDPAPLQNIGNRAAGDFVPEVEQRSLDPTIAPIPVLFGHSDDQGLDRIGSTPTARSTLPTPVVPLGGRSVCDARRARFRASHWWPPLTRVSVVNFGLGSQIDDADRR